jgi:aminocarboxymuconate-semialdehyde decarboxylase
LIALDVHAHLAPVLPGALAGIDGVAWDGARGALVVDGHPVAMKPLYEPSALLRWMDEHRVSRAWISVPPPLYRQHLDAAAAVRWADYLNAGLRQICDAHADRLAPLYHLPLEHPRIAAELAGAWLQRDAAGFAIAAGGPAGHVYSDAALDPLWARLDAAGVFVFVHPGHCCDGRLQAFYLENLAGNPYETGIAAAHLVFSGVPERFPRLRLCLAHGGGTTAMLAGRWQRGRDTTRPGVDPGVEAPAASLRRLYADCIVHDAAALELAAHVFGDDHVLFGSDWPFPMGLPDPHAQLADVAADLRARILRDNAQRLLAAKPASGA